MKADRSFIEAMRHATQLVRTRGPVAATRFIQGLFRSDRATPPAAPVRVDAEPVVDTIVEVLEPAPARAPQADEAPSELPGESGEFLAKRFSGHAGARNYKLYIPSSYAGAPLPLIVMLHGCKQDPDDFAIGTRANRWAETTRCLVAYPEQIQRANAHRCWNWFRPIDQHAGRGEPAIIAGIARQVIDEYQIDARRVYVAGLSAGGAMAVIMGQAYPELFAAIGVHSGLPAEAAHDVASALALMKTGQATPTLHAATAPSARPSVPIIVLHGDADSTVNPSNAHRLIENAAEAHRQANPNSPLQVSVDAFDATDDSNAYRRTRYAAEHGRSVIERWEIRGAGHAWSGGNAAGSYTGARGPDATKAVLEFFAQHATQAEASHSADSTAPV